MQAGLGLVLAMTYSYRDCIINFYGIWPWKYTVCSKDTFLTQGSLDNEWNKQHTRKTYLC